MAGGPANRMVQAAFRVRNDDGVESLSEANGGATKIVADNTNWSQLPDEPFRLRILNTHANTGTVFNGWIQLKYSHNGGPFVDIFDDSSIVRTRITSYWTHYDHSTEFVGRLGTGTWAQTFTIYGHLIDDADEETESYVSKFFCPNNDARETETEWCLEIVGVDVSPGDTIDFRMYDWGNGTPYSDGYTFTPRATVASPNVPPTITNTPAATAPAGVDYAEQMTAAGTDPKTWELTEAPAGAMIGSSTGLIAWVPDADEVGTVHDFTAVVTGPESNTDTLSWTVTVAEVQLTGSFEVDAALGGTVDVDAALGGSVEV